MANRLSQEGLEVLVASTQVGNRVSQEGIEAVYSTDAAKSRLSQTGLEVLVVFTKTARVSQIGFEVLVPSRTIQPRLAGTSSLSANVTALHRLTVTLAGTSSLTVTVSTATAEVDVPFIPSNTVVYGIFSLFTAATGFGPGNGGEVNLIRLAPNSTSVTATLITDITNASGNFKLSGDSGLPQTVPFVITIDSETLYVSPAGSSQYWIIGRPVSNTTRADHTAGTSATWNDSYDMAIVAGVSIAANFTADITSSGLTTYPGWLVCFDSSQAYSSSSRYPMHVTSVLGVFDAGAGSGGTNRCDGAQPNAIATPTGVSDNCPAALANPARISSAVNVGDVALVRYENPEATVLDLGPRSASLQSWFGLKRVDTTDHDVTFTNPNGIVVDTTGTYDTFTGSVNDEWLNPSFVGIAPATGLPTTTAVPYTTVTLPGVDRFFTYGPPGYNEKGWPMACLAVRQGSRRVPFWQSWDWHNYGYVYCGFGTDDTFCQILVNRNGIVFNSVPVVELPGPQDISGPEAVWDDGSYYFGASWYVVIFGTPYLVAGPLIGGGFPGLDAGGPGIVPVVSFGHGTTPSSPVVNIPTVEGGSGGDIPAPSGLHIWYRPWKIS